MLGWQLFTNPLQTCSLAPNSEDRHPHWVGSGFGDNLGPMSETMVARAKNPSKKSLSALQIQAARAYGTGMPRREIAKAMMEALTPTTVGRPREVRMQAARHKLRTWERNQAFRDYVYNHAVTNVDMATPAILNGVVQRAVRGRVDAARLALEITGRHNPKGDNAPPTVVVAIDGIARPTVKQIADAEVVDAEPS